LRRVIFRALGNGHYRLADAQHGIELDVDRLRRDRSGELVGELAVACSLLGSKAIDGVMSVGTFNLSSIRSRQERARALAERARTGGKVDFLGLLEELCQRVLQAERDGTPVIVLRDLPRPTPEEEINVMGFKVPAKHATILFGDGGTLKSFQLLNVLGHLARDGRNVVLFDWELDASTHRRRLEQLFGTEMPAVRYVRCDRPLVHEVDYAARLVHREAIDYAGFDSCGFATDGPPEAAEAALGYFRAVRQLGVGSLHIAHTTKSGDNTEYRPFGSAFWHNSARATWFAKRAGESADGSTVNLGLFHRKANLGPLSQPIAFEVTFDADGTRFRGVDAGDVEELAASLPLWGRIRSELRGGTPQTLATLAEQLGVKPDSVEKAVKRRTDVFTKVHGKDGIRRIALVERRAS
jgi:hypothetical protein